MVILIYEILGENLTECLSWCKRTSLMGCKVNRPSNCTGPSHKQRDFLLNADFKPILWGIPALPLWSSFKNCHQIFPHFFLWIQTPTRCQFCGHWDKMPDLDNFDGTFQHLKRVAQQTADLGSFDGTFQQLLVNKLGGSLSHSPLTFELCSQEML